MKSLRESETLRLFFVQKKEFSGKWRILKVIGKISTDTKGGKGGIAMELRRFQEELEEKILGEYAAKAAGRGAGKDLRKNATFGRIFSETETVSSIVNPSAA